MMHSDVRSAVSACTSISACLELVEAAPWIGRQPLAHGASTEGTMPQRSNLTGRSLRASGPGRAVTLPLYRYSSRVDGPKLPCSSRGGPQPQPNRGARRGHPHPLTNKSTPNHGSDVSCVLRIAVFVSSAMMHQGPACIMHANTPGTLSCRVSWTRRPLVPSIFRLPCMCSFPLSRGLEGHSRHRCAVPFILPHTPHGMPFSTSCQ